ncbi:C2H2-type domain-containing protein [Fusarium sp. LHS14.1]|nr:C2H2-type domain-containing protein [Fusarium sp. LHS14.1]
MDLTQEQGAIAHNVQNVLSSFRNVAALFKQGSRFPDDRCESEDVLRLLPTFDKEITRFKMWAGNLGAHQSGPASLDHRLREAPHLQQQVVYLLRDKCESLEDAVSSFSNQESPKGTKDTQHEHISQQESTGQGNEDDFTDSDLDDDEDVSLETRVSSLCADISEATDCLLRLSVAIANPAPHERFRKLGAGPSEDVSFYEAHDIRYVRDKFPRASKSLPDVLGKFITRRRQFFKYREAHHAKLAAGLDQEAQKDTSRTEIVPKTVASSLPEHFKGTAVIDEDNRSDMAISETSYATSAGLLVQEDGQAKPATPLKVPPPPPEAEKGAFECPFCYRMIFASTRRAWKRHVFGDLRPYTCLFSHCTESNIDFDRRHQWQLHVSKYHWRSWSCPFKCRGMFPSSQELEDHIRHQHLANASNERLRAVIARGEVPVPFDISKECPLCGHVVSGLKSYVKHVGRHLEQLALFALPDIKDEVPEENVEGDEQNDVESKMDAGSMDSDISEVSSRQSHERLETSSIGGIANEVPEGQKSISGADKSAKEAHGSNTGPRRPSQKAMLSRALVKANFAVELDNAQNFEGAKEAYSEACDLLTQVIQRTSDSEDERKLRAIRLTYSSRIAELEEMFGG